MEEMEQIRGCLAVI